MVSLIILLLSARLVPAALVFALSLCSCWLLLFLLLFDCCLIAAVHTHSNTCASNQKVHLSPFGDITFRCPFLDVSVCHELKKILRRIYRVNQQQRRTIQLTPFSLCLHTHILHPPCACVYWCDPFSSNTSKLVCVVPIISPVFPTPLSSRWTTTSIATTCLLFLL